MLGMHEPSVALVMAAPADEPAESGGGGGGIGGGGGKGSAGAAGAWGGGILLQVIPLPRDTLCHAVVSDL